MVAKIPRTKKRGVWQSLAFTIFLGLPALALMAFLAFSDYKIYKQRQEAKNEADKLRQEVMVLQERNEMLKEGLSHADKEYYLEEKLRDQGYKKPGEEVWAVIKDSKADLEAASQASDSFWLDLWQKIKKIQ